MTAPDHSPGYRNTLRAMQTAGMPLTPDQLAAIGEDPTDTDDQPEPHRGDQP